MYIYIYTHNHFILMLECFTFMYACKINAYIDTNLTSPLNNMDYNFRFSKLHSKTSKLLIKGLYPYYFHGDVTPEKDDITLITSINKYGLEDLYRLAEIWQGPISAVLHLPTLTYNDSDPDIIETLREVQNIYDKNIKIKKFV